MGLFILGWSTQFHNYRNHTETKLLHLKPQVSWLQWQERWELGLKDQRRREASLRWMGNPEIESWNYNRTKTKIVLFVQAVFWTYNMVLQENSLFSKADIPSLHIIPMTYNITQDFMYWCIREGVRVIITLYE